MLLHNVIKGQGESAVLIHGLFGSTDNLNVIANALSEHYQVINIDVRNHGQSFHTQHIDYPSMAQDVINVLKYHNIASSHLIGHSMGGKIAMQLALSHPEYVKKLAVLDIAPVAYHARHNDIFAALQSVASQHISSRSQADTLMQAHIPELGVRQFLLKSLRKTQTGEFNWQFNLPALIENYPAILAKLEANTPFQGDTLFIKGSNSDYIAAEHRNAIAQLFPRAKAKIINGAGHWLHAEKPAAVNKSISDFLRR